MLKFSDGTVKNATVPSKEGVENEAFQFIVKSEGFNSKCYIDGAGGGYSQGYGHMCLGGKISELDSRQILLKDIIRINELIIGDFSINQRVGMISFLYNHPVTQKGYINRINNNFPEFQSLLWQKSNNHVYHNGVRQGGLLTRRKEEYDLIFN